MEKFEEILFSQAHKFAETEEEKLTIKYPFCLRTGDIVLKEDAQNIITERKVRKKGSQLFMDIVFEKVDLKENCRNRLFIIIGFVPRLYKSKHNDIP